MKTGRLILVILLAVAAACKRKGGAQDAGPPDLAPTLGPVAVQDLTPPGAVPPGARLNADALTAELQNKLRSGGVFSTHTGDGGTGPGLPMARVRVELGIEEVRHDGKAAARAIVRFRVDTRPSGLSGQHWNEDVQAQGETIFPVEPEPDRKAIYAKLVSRTLGDLAASYVTRQRIWRGGPKEVSAALNADAGEARAEAIRVAAQRNLTSEVPTLLRLLSDEDESTRDAALGALVVMRERRAVSALAKQRSMRDQREMRKILDAISMLGGDEAVEYLSFVAEAHEDEEIKQMAKKALDRLKRRSGGGGSGGGGGKP